ncbi:MAG: hypothetical protein LBM00_00095 [Deltaproteobacteria bacterium]|jgi:hypothetical protein|nr:hypothetical protein [Deltaproteobacteria bacterium]
MATGNFWKYGLALGAGVAIGAVGAVLLSRGNINLKKACAGLLSRGLDIKDRAAGFAGTAKENLEDIAAEARYEQELRKNGEKPA